MQGTITLDQAIKRGNKVLIWYPYLIVIATGIFATVFCFLAGISWGKGAVIGLVSGIILAIIYACYMTTKWRIWAFSRVADIQELKKSAITYNLIPMDGSWQEKLEIRSKADKLALLQIQQRFNDHYVFTDDRTVPDETVFRISKGSKFQNFFLMIVIAVIGICLLFLSPTYQVTGFIFLVMAGIIFMQYRKMNTAMPQVIINAKGIETISSGFHSWNDISGEGVDFGSGKSYALYLKFNFPGGNEQVDIKDMGVAADMVNHVLLVYRRRYEKSQQISNL